jgi:hypothetical protein
VEGVSKMSMNLTGQHFGIPIDKILKQRLIEMGYPPETIESNLTGIIQAEGQKPAISFGGPEKVAPYKYPLPGGGIGYSNVDEPGRTDRIPLGTHDERGMPFVQRVKFERPEEKQEPSPLADVDVNILRMSDSRERQLRDAITDAMLYDYPIEHQKGLRKQYDKLMLEKRGLFRIPGYGLFKRTKKGPVKVAEALREKKPIDYRTTKEAALLKSQTEIWKAFINASKNEGKWTEAQKIEGQIIKSKILNNEKIISAWRSAKGDNERRMTPDGQVIHVSQVTNAIRENKKLIEKIKSFEGQRKAGRVDIDRGLRKSKQPKVPIKPPKEEKPIRIPKIESSINIAQRIVNVYKKDPLAAQRLVSRFEEEFKGPEHKEARKFLAKEIEPYARELISGKRRPEQYKVKDIPSLIKNALKKILPKGTTNKRMDKLGREINDQLKQGININFNDFKKMAKEVGIFWGFTKEEFEQFMDQIKGLGEIKLPIKKPRKGYMSKVRKAVEGNF